MYVLDLRGIDNATVCQSKESIWMDVKILVRYLKFNDPEIPLVLGGHGYGASIALLYSSWKAREPVNGYLFVSPIVDLHGLDVGLVRRENFCRLFGSLENSWFFPRYV